MRSIRSWTGISSLGPAFSYDDLKTIYSHNLSTTAALEAASTSAFGTTISEPRTFLILGKCLRELLQSYLRNLGALRPRARKKKERKQQNSLSASNIFFSVPLVIATLRLTMNE